MSKALLGKRILVTGGTGSLGQTIVRRILSGEMGEPARVTVLSRDEAKQHYMRLDYQKRISANDGLEHRRSLRLLAFQIGDIRDYHTLVRAIRQADVVINAAALKQVPVCEYFPYEAVRTNIEGPENIVRAIEEHHLPVETVVGISTDKACKPVSTMGLSKALHERIFIAANLRCPDTRFIAVRCGNMLASRGSVIPIFQDQIRRGGPVTVTSGLMTRFLVSLDDAVDCLFAAIRGARRGEIYVPRAPSAKVLHVAQALIGNRPVETVITGNRPGEKTHELMVSEEEAERTVRRDQWYVITPALPELVHDQPADPGLSREYSSRDSVLTLEQTRELLRSQDLLLEDELPLRIERVRTASAFGESW